MVGRRKDMKELTIIFNAQITMIMKGEESMVADERTIAGRVKDMLGADDVVVSGMKIFSLEGEGDGK